MNNKENFLLNNKFVDNGDIYKIKNGTIYTYNLYISLIDSNYSQDIENLINILNKNILYPKRIIINIDPLSLLDKDNKEFRNKIYKFLNNNILIQSNGYIDIYNMNELASITNFDFLPTIENKKIHILNLSYTNTHSLKKLKYKINKIASLDLRNNDISFDYNDVFNLPSNINMMIVDKSSINDYLSNNFKKENNFIILNNSEINNIKKRAKLEKIIN